MEKKVIDILDRVGCRQVKIDEELLETGILDSFKIMELICELETMFHIKLMPDEIVEMDNFSSVKNIVSFIERKIELPH